MKIHGFVIVLALLPFATIIVRAEDPSTSNAQQETKDDAETLKLRAILDSAVEQFEVLPVRSDAGVMTAKSVLRWTNDERDSHSVGVVVLWIDRGQPAAAMATYSWADALHHEFDLLARTPVIARRDQQIVWKPKSGLKFQTIPDAPEVASTGVARLRQMKSLAGKFSATMMGWRSDKSDRTELRRLPRELFRYQPEDADTVDGAVFAFVQGTDPEALVLIEAVNVNNQAEWQYAFVRQTSGELQGRYLDQVVWSEKAIYQRSDSTSSGLSLGSRINLKAELSK